MCKHPKKCTFCVDVKHFVHFLCKNTCVNRGMCVNVKHFVQKTYYDTLSQPRVTMSQRSVTMSQPRVTMSYIFFMSF